MLDADDNYDGTSGEDAGDPTAYRRFRYNEDTEGEYLWKDPSIEAHGNIDYSDPLYIPENGGPATRTTDGLSGGLIDTAKDSSANRYADVTSADAAAGDYGGQGSYVTDTESESNAGGSGGGE